MPAQRRDELRVARFRRQLNRAGRNPLEVADSGLVVSQVYRLLRQTEAASSPHHHVDVVIHRADGIDQRSRSFHDPILLMVGDLQDGDRQRQTCGDENREGRKRAPEHASDR